MHASLVESSHSWSLTFSRWGLHCAFGCNVCCCWYPVDSGKLVKGPPLGGNARFDHAIDTRLFCAQPVDVNKLVKGRPLDNMEFMQWLKFYFEGRLGCQDLDYDPVGRRYACDMN